MSDNAIRVGDLVQIVRDGNCMCSPHPSLLLGQIFTVTELVMVDGRCRRCGRFPGPVDIGATGHRAGPLDMYRLRKIPDLWELDEAERKIEEPIT